MKKSVILLTLLLVASLAGTYAVYELYVKARIKELSEHLEEEKQLKNKLTTLEETFFKTKPDTVLRVWRNEIQPWENAVRQRALFFNLGEIPLDVEIPVEQRDIAKFYYKKVYPEMTQELDNRLYEANLYLPDPTFGIPHPDTYGRGASPAPKQISRHLARFEFGKAVADLLIDANVTSVSVLEVWPERNELSGRSGDVKSRTTGLSFTIRMQDFVRFLDMLSQENRYFEVKSLHLTNRTLRYSNADLNVQMVLAQAYYKEDEKGKETSVSGGPAQMRTAFSEVFGGPLPSRAAARSTRRRKTFWQSFRQKYIPF